MPLIHVKAEAAASGARHLQLGPSEHERSDRRSDHTAYQPARFAQPTSAGIGEGRPDAPRLPRIPAAPSPHSSRAIVLGASVAGLLTAAVLTAHCAEVVVVDRDPLDSDDPTPRRGVPQGRQPHGLLVAGVRALEALLPGFSDELLELGALRSDVLRDSVWIMRRAPLARFDSGLVGVLGTRPLLESHIRRRVRALAGVTLLGQHDILRLTATPDGTRFTGAAIAARDEGRPVTMEADLVVDATGRGSRAPRWLAELGYSAPPTQEVAIDIRYVSRFFQDVPGLLEGTDAVVVAAHPPNLAGGIALRQEGGTWLVMLSGRHGLQPPTEVTEFAEFADTLPTPALAHLARTAAPISAAETYRFPASRWRHYEQLDRRPQGLAVIGDAVCSFNPAYGQGISSAGQQALALAELLAPVTDSSGLARAAANAADVLAKVVATPWALATGPDRRFPGMPAKPFAERIVDRYMDRLVAVAHQDPGGRVRLDECPQPAAVSSGPADSGHGGPGAAPERDRSPCRAGGDSAWGAWPRRTGHVKPPVSWRPALGDFWTLVTIARRVATSCSSRCPAESSAARACPESGRRSLLGSPASFQQRTAPLARPDRSQ